jgi:hypothetical protein
MAQLGPAPAKSPLSDSTNSGEQQQPHLSPYQARAVGRKDLTDTCNALEMASARHRVVDARHATAAAAARTAMINQAPKYIKQRAMINMDNMPAPHLCGRTARR